MQTKNCNDRPLYYLSALTLPKFLFSSLVQLSAPAFAEVDGLGTASDFFPNINQAFLRIHRLSFSQLSLYFIFVVKCKVYLYSDCNDACQDV
jgi:hypothetical protein